MCVSVCARVEGLLRLMAERKAFSVFSSALCDVTRTMVSSASLCTRVAPLAPLLIQKPCEYTPRLLLHCLFERSLKEEHEKESIIRQEDFQDHGNGSIVVVLHCLIGLGLQKNRGQDRSHLTM